jgi:protein-S-isoprenylcysteine O-methyltransferase Ste14
LNLVADRQFKLSATTVKPFEASSALLTDGAFRYSRHPMYLGMVGILLHTARRSDDARPVWRVVQRLLCTGSQVDLSLQ